MPEDDSKPDEDYTRRVMKARNLEEFNNMQRGRVSADYTHKEKKKEQ